MGNGYIQAEILGRVRGLKFNSLAAENIMSDLASLMVATGGNYTSAMMTVIVYWGLYGNAWAKKQELDLSFEQVGDWMDDVYTDPAQAEILTQIVRCYEDSKASKTVLETLNNAVEEVKKKIQSLT